MKRLSSKKLAGWLAMSMLVACDPTTDRAEIEPDEPVAALASALSRNAQADLSFSESGRGRLFAPTNAAWIGVVTDGGSGKVAFASGGWNGDLQRYEGYVGRVTAVGTRDTTWSWNESNPGGDRVLNDDLLGDYVYPQAMQVVGGYTYVAGWMTVASGRRSFLVKLDAHGQLVPGFGNGQMGGVIKPIPVGYDDYQISKIFVVGDKIYTIGTASRTVAGDPKRYAAVARFATSDGDWDRSYGNDGWAIRETPGAVVGGMAAGKPEVVIASNSKVFRFDAKGDYETDFGTRTYNGIIDVAVASDGRVFLLSNSTVSESGEWRYNTAGDRLIALKASGVKDDAFAYEETPDSGHNGPAGPAPPDFFDERGIAVLTSEGQFRSVRVEYNERLGRIYVLGTSTVGSDPAKKYWTTLGLLPNGQYDRSYGEYGRVYTDFTKIDNEVAWDMALQTFWDTHDPGVPPVLREAVLMSGLGTPEHKGPLARVLIDYGHAGEPCRSNACNGGLECKTEWGGAVGNIHVKVCRPAD
jgi:hypothetical protein